MDSRDVLEKEISEAVGVVLPGSWELRLFLRKKDAKIPIRLPSELRRLVEPRLEFVVSTVSIAWREPLRNGSWSDSAAISCASFSEMSSGSIDTLDGPRAWTVLETLPREYRIARASETTGSSMGLSSGVGSWLFPWFFGVVGMSSLCGRGGVDGRTSSIGVDASFSIPRPTAPCTSLRGVTGVPASAAAFCFSARLSRRRLKRS
jgi:hypothetical protein